MSVCIRTRTTVVGTALGALLLSPLAAAPASAAVPVGWEATALGLPAAQRLSQGSGVTVAVLDSGVMTNHPDLKGRVTTGPDYFGDGRSPGDPKWGAHGTAMASEVLKVAPQAKILSIRMIDESAKTDPRRYKGSGSPIAKGINYAVGHGADVITMSLGTEDVFGANNEDEADAIGYAVSHGVPVLASAGNDGDIFNEPSYPAAFSSVIAVAATQQNGAHADFSTVRTYNAVAAPGVGITSAKNTGGTSLSNGTSPACALAAGVVALMRSRNDKLTPAQIRTILTTTAHHPAGGHNALVGYGQIDAAAAVKPAGSPPPDRATVLAYKGTKHLATPDGTPKTTHPEMDQVLWLGGLGAAGAGLLMVIGCVLLALKGRRRTAA